MAVPPTVFVDVACAPDGIGADEVAVYWTALCGPGSINRTAIADGSTTALVPSEPNAYALRIDGDAVYWEVITSLDPHAIDGEVSSIPKDGGSAAVIASGLPHPEGEPGSFLVDEANVYWSSAGDSTVMSVPKAGTAAPTVLAQAAAPPIIAVDTSYVFWTDGTAVQRIDKRTLESKTVYQATSGIQAISARGSAVFIWTRTQAEEGRFALFASTDDLATTPSQLLDDQQDVSYLPLLVDESHVYWLEGTTIMRSDYDGNVDDWVALLQDGEVSDLASNSTAIFWTDNSRHRIYTAAK